MPIAQDDVLNALKQCYDPEIPLNIVDLGLIYGVEVEEIDGKSNLLVIMTMTTPACPYAPELLQEVKNALRALPDAGSVEVRLTMSPPWTPDRMTEDARDQLGLF